jgi:hypothetical protein
MDTWGAVGFVYFLLLIFLTTFFAINLVLAVIFDTFSGAHSGFRCVFVCLWCSSPASA